jgi:indolepyruvate ferredoxin oxidoreductase beta subunit
VAFEMTEAARRIHYLKPEGRLLVNTRVIEPLPVLIGAASMPDELEALLAENGAIFIDAEALACEAASEKSANVVLIGALSTGLPFPIDSWREIIASRVPPKTVEANLRAFDLGRAACEQGVCDL